MTAEPCRFAHQAHQIDSIALNLAPISYTGPFAGLLAVQLSQDCGQLNKFEFS